ncbi:protein serine/threonine phosphatase 2C [Backusella circina FSU 941]|nr:protein serine/threonine phosphatase 2C [Backusella circina FSU 941]
MDSVDTELSQLNLSEQLRANSSFMKIIATLFHYGNQSMSAAQLVSAVRTLDLLQLRGETPKSTVQGIISTSRKIARDLKLPDPFRIDKDGASRQAKYAIADDVLNGATMPDQTDIPDEPIILRPVEHAPSNHYYASATSTKRARKSGYYDGIKRNCRKRVKSAKKKEGSDGSDIEVDSDEDFELTIESEDETPTPETVEEDTIFDYSLLYSPPPSDATYIDAINFSEYPIAAHFAIVQQKGYSYPRFRSHEKIKIPKLNCEDKFRVTDILKSGKVVGRMFIIADGHGGPGCSEYFVRNTPEAVQALCDHYDDLTDTKVQERFTRDMKKMVQQLDEAYLKIKRAELYKTEIDTQQHEEEHVDNDGCTLIINVFLGDWLVNINVGDSRSIVISAPEPSLAPPNSIENANTAGIDTDYKMDVVFASQDHKPYLEHLAREILENGGEFVDSVQNRVIKVELDKLKEDGNRHTKRIALKNARIRPKGYHQAGHDHQSTNGAEVTAAAAGGWAAQSAVRTTAQQAPTHYNKRLREDRIPSLNVARSCGDLDFKMDPEHKIISCEPDVTFIKISDQPQNEAGSTILANGPHKERRRHFLFMSTDGTFDYMYEETADRQNRAIAKVIGPMIEDGEKIGKYLLEEEERIKGQTIEHKSEQDDTSNNNKKKEEQPKEVVKTEDMDVDVGSTENNNKKEEDENKSKEETQEKKTNEPELNENNKDIAKKGEEEEEEEEADKDNNKTKKKKKNNKTEDKEKKDESTDTIKEDTEMVDKEQDESTTTKQEGETNGSSHKKKDDTSQQQDDSIKQEQDAMQVDTEVPRIPLLHKELTLEENQARKIKERTLVMSARYFANRESAHGFFASTLQDYDDCTIILVEI